MFSRCITRSLRVPAAVRCYSEAGSTGAPRNDGSEDNFTQRERAQEDYYVRQHEKEQLELLKKQLHEQGKKLEKLENDMKKKWIDGDSAEAFFGPM